MSIREKLATLRKKQETQKGENEQRFNDSHDKEQDLVKKES